jgi:flagellar motor protein MotB
MKFLTVTGAAAVFLLIGSLSPVSAQREEKPGKPEEQRAQQPQKQQQPEQHAQQPQKQQQPQQRAQQPQKQEPQQRAQQPQKQEPQQHAQQPQPQRQQQPQQRAQQTPQQHVQQQPQRPQQQAQAWQQQRGWLKPGGWQGRGTFQQDSSQNWASDHRTWEQRGGYGGSYIAQNSYNLYFGSQHFFHLGLLSTMYLGYPRFAYGGYSFLLVDPYPGNWAPNWYSSDNCYIDYENGYYLHDSRYPGVNLAITIAL